MEFLGIKIGSEIILSNPFITNVLLIIVILAVIKIAFGKEIILLFKIGLSSWSQRSKTESIAGWEANCIQRNGWFQRGDAKALDIEGRYLKKLSFTVSVIGRPNNWRGGFILGNQRFAPQTIVDQANAITIHTGSPPPIAQAQHVWIYDDLHGRNNPDSTTVTAINIGQIHFQIDINSDNFLSVFVNGQQVYFKRIDLSFRKKVYLLAWGDNTNCRVRFANINITF